MADVASMSMPTAPASPIKKATKTVKKTKMTTSAAKKSKVPSNHPQFIDMVSQAIQVRMDLSLALCFKM